MRKFVALAGCFIPLISFAGNLTGQPLGVYQDLCAKEQDPVKRYQYCQMLNQSNLQNPRFEPMKQGIAIG